MACGTGDDDDDDVDGWFMLIPSCFSIAQSSGRAEIRTPSGIED
jgi:hypothetical protein